MNPGYGRDKRRRLTSSEQAELFARAGGKCQRCGVDLEADYHNAHLAAWVNGGATDPANMEAWCAACNLRLGATDVVESIADTELREWQSRALAKIVHQLWQRGMATIHATPGAGKTIFAGAVFQTLAEAGFADRLLVVVPNLPLVEQWQGSLAGHMRIHLDDEPRNGHLEHPDTVGLVVTYQGVSNVAAAHITSMERANKRTLVVLDEVHHIADDKSWGLAVRTMVGNAASGEVEHAAGVLNMTGTLFRSSKSQRIATVRYRPVETPEGEKFQAEADVSVPTAELIGAELRAPDLHVYGGEVRLLDVEKEEILDMEVADLNRKQRATFFRGAVTRKSWVTEFARAALALLATQQQAIGSEEHLKLLYVAHDQRAAERAADVINEIMGGDFAVLVISDQQGAVPALHRAAREKRSLAIVSVRMVTEGFDCPEIATIAYASNVIADLSVAQTMARAMRLTTTERKRQMMLPAKILIPDHPELRRAFASALVSALHEVVDKDDDDGGGGGGGGGMQRFQLLDITDPRFKLADVLTEENGEVPADEHAVWEERCLRLNIPVPWAARVALAAREDRPPPLRTYSKTPDEGEGDGTPTVVTTVADPRTLVNAYRQRLKNMAGWMGYHVAHDAFYNSVRVFQYEANKAAGIPPGGRDHATVDQLKRAVAWAEAYIRSHCGAHEEPLPSCVQGDTA